VRRENPGEFLSKLLQRDDCRQDETLYARALRLVGELRRQDCMPALTLALSSASDAIRFWANWSATLLGDRHSSQAIKGFVLSPGPYQDLAIQLAFRMLPVEKAREWISVLAKDDTQVRAVIKATAVLGDPHAINWLIGKMQDAKLAKLAGEAFSLITGLDLKEQQLTLESPEGYLLIPSDEESNDNVDLDEDENLAHPDSQKVSAFWQQQGSQFIVGRRYFMGKPISTDILQHTLTHGSQRQRHAAAMELALNENGAPLINTRARVANV
jgi:uncharacterized protein (TIGR02270 family)